MICKYCHLNTHYIEKCPTILCKKCKEIGHPQWLCKDKKINKNTNKYTITKEIIKTPKEEILIQNKNIHYYLKFENKLWSEI
jgi:hypothetical protein